MIPSERNTHVKYESPTSYGVKVMANVKVFQKGVNFQGQGHKVKMIVLCERSGHTFVWNTHWKCKSPTSYSTLVKANVKVFQK